MTFFHLVTFFVATLYYFIVSFPILDHFRSFLLISSSSVASSLISYFICFHDLYTASFYILFYEATYQLLILIIIQLRMAWYAGARD